VKESAKGSQTLKADFKTDIGNSQVIGEQQFFCLFDAAFDQILVWRLVEGLAKQSQEMITRETRLARNLIETERMIETMVDIFARPTQALIDFGSQRVHFEVRLESSCHGDRGSIKDS
jgi:hypothetical protein